MFSTYMHWIVMRSHIIFPNCTDWRCLVRPLFVVAREAHCSHWYLIPIWTDFWCFVAFRTKLITTFIILPHPAHRKESSEEGCKIWPDQPPTHPHTPFRMMDCLYYIKWNISATSDQIFSNLKLKLSWPDWNN